MTSGPVYDSGRAAHAFDVSLIPARCVLCGVPAAHVVVECLSIDGDPRQGYLCCEHFSWIIYDCARSVRTVPAQRGAGL
jgi:hypothetical protein